MAAIRPIDLPSAPSVPGGAAIIIDNGTTVQKATPLQVSDAARPLASQAEAEAGANNAKCMSPLRVKQAIDAQAISLSRLAEDDGSDLVGFIQSGTGAVARTAQDKMRDVLHASDFGVVSAPSWAGSSDQSTKLQAAINAAKAAWRDLVLPPGIIRIDNPLNCTGMFAGGLTIRGAGYGSANAGTGTVILANTGGVVFDFTGSQYCGLEDVVIDGNVFSPPNPSTIGILYARATTSAYAQFNHLRNVVISLPSDMTANDGEGAYGLLNIASEIHDYHNIYVTADNPAACLSNKPSWLSSPFLTIDTSITSMSVIAFTGHTTLTGLSVTRPAFRGMALKACAFDMLYTVGSGTCAIDLDGAENFIVKAGSMEGQGYIIASLFNTRNTEFNVYALGASSTAPIVMPAAFGSIRNLTLRTSYKSGWSHIVKSGNVGSVVEGMCLELDEDTGGVPTSNMPNISNVLRRVSTGISAGGPMDMDLIRPRILDGQKFTPVAAASVANNSLFLDNGTGKLSYKDGAGAITPLY